MILVVPKKALTPNDKKQLLKKGYVVVECDKPESVRVLSPETMVDKSDLFLSALAAIRPKFAFNESEKFVEELCKRLMPEKKQVVEKKAATIEKPPVDNEKKIADTKTTLKEPIKQF